MIPSRKKQKFSAEFFILAAAVSIAPVMMPSESFAQAYVSSVPALTNAVPRPAYASPYGTAGYGYGAQNAQSSGRSARAGGSNSSSQSASSSDTSSSSGSASMPSLSGSPTDSAKANQLAVQAEQQRALDGTVDQQDIDAAGLAPQAPPPDMTALQQVNKSQPAMAGGLTVDDPVNKSLSLDMRRDAQKEAALSYGARGGLAKRNFEIMERMKGFETVLDKVFDFRALLIKAPSGMLIEPPIVKESDKAVVVTDGGDEAAVADRVYDINKKAKIVTAPRDWRTYLIQSWAQVPPPPRILWPKNQKEQANWDSWVAQGWQAGVEQADEIFEAQVNQLVADYNGMVRYKMLLAQDMISAPYIYQDDRGVAGNNNQMRVGDRALRITGPAQFLTKADLWKPANQ